MVDITGDLDVPQRLLQTLRIRDAAPSTANPFSAGEYQDADGTVVGSYTISVTGQVRRRKQKGRSGRGALCAPDQHDGRGKRVEQLAYCGGVASDSRVSGRHRRARR